MEFPEQEPGFREVTDQTCSSGGSGAGLEQQFDIAGEEVEEENAAEIAVMI